MNWKRFVFITAVLLAFPYLIYNPTARKVKAIEHLKSNDAPVCFLQKGKKDLREAQAMPWANKIGACEITYYCPCAACCGKSDGITYSGSNAVPYETCAVDLAVIPLGSAVMVDFGDGLMEVYRAEDTGSGVDGNHIDIFVSSHEEAKNLGVKEATVYWLPVE